ncbi:WXG100 family type VII secretion target [Thermopolyspora sp. NPDC052614]|uniref:WXG100 family type VII secretion target n=1 Tax=Thermopolyspora sp. NPDC052614 TaxID=3155682 RepID=UPI00341A3EE9
MADSKVGGILPDMDKMSQTFRAQADAVMSVQKALDAEARKIPASWSGPNAQKFLDAWESYKKTFDNVQQTLVEAQEGIRKNREAIAAATGA